MTADVQPAPGDRPARRNLLGLVLLIPAAACCILQFVIPTVRTFLTSLQEADLLSEARFVGFENYAFLVEREVFRGALGFAALLIGTRLLAVAIVPALLAYAVSHFGRATRSAVRVLFTIPIALFMPATIALSWFVVTSSQRIRVFADPDTAPWAFLFVDGLYTLGLACGVGLIFYLAALRRAEAATPAKKWLPVGAAWLTAVFAAIASALQSFTLSYGLTGGGPGTVTSTPMFVFYRLAFQQLRLGPAAAIGVVILLALAPLGIILGAVAAFGGLQLQSEPAGSAPASNRKTIGVVLLVVTLLIAGGGCALSALPAGLIVPQAFEGFGQLTEVAPLGRIFANTVLPALLSALLIQTPVAYAGALGIGALRPLGRRSEALLLLFSPWLFVTVGPLSLAFFESLRASGGLNSWAALLPPISLSLPMLFILTLFFKGQAAKWQAARQEQPGGRAFMQALVLPSLPLTLLLACAALFVALQDVWWPLLVGRGPETATAGVALLAMAGGVARSGVLAAGLTLFSLPSFLFFWLAFSAFQVSYLERLSLTVEDR